jgi:hypothetical protein
MIFRTSAVAISLTATAYGEQIRRADALADLIAEGEVTVIYDIDRFVTIKDNLPQPTFIWWLPEAVA